MKKIFLALVIISGFITIQGQEESSTARQNDIMISPIELIAGSALNISYERLLNKDSGVGINALLLLDNGDSGSGIQSQIAPYYRMYFGKNMVADFLLKVLCRLQAPMIQFISLMLDLDIIQVLTNMRKTQQLVQELVLVGNGLQDEILFLKQVLVSLDVLE